MVETASVRSSAAGPRLLHYTQIFYCFLTFVNIYFINAFFKKNAHVCRQVLQQPVNIHALILPPTSVLHGKWCMCEGGRWLSAIRPSDWLQERLVVWRRPEILWCDWFSSPKSSLRSSDLVRSSPAASQWRRLLRCETQWCMTAARCCCGTCYICVWCEEALFNFGSMQTDLWAYYNWMNQRCCGEAVYSACWGIFCLIRRVILILPCSLLAWVLTGRTWWFSIC